MLVMLTTLKGASHGASHTGGFGEMKLNQLRLSGCTAFVACGALMLCALGAPHSASAGTAISICPTSGTVGGSGLPDETTSNVAGPLDGTCGANSAVMISIAQSQEYGKLTFSSSSAGFPGTVLGDLLGMSASVAFTSGGGADQPYYELAFIDGSGSVGQSNPGDQILMIEFQSGALSGSTLAMDPNATEFNLYDNTTNSYLNPTNNVLGGQQATNTLAGWLTYDPNLNNDTLQEVRIAEGLTGGGTNADSMTINSFDMTVPEPASLTIFGMALAGIGFIRRKRAG